ncbi:MAG: T9SS type A sorting domain-containing protein [Bacteroidetes bacterium]|nr:T9SS type A sorting domain-containing protein [Bacteroidota bacterium]
MNITNTKENNSIKIYDVFGKLIHTSKTNHEITRVETGNLTPGMYLIHYIENKKIHVMKMVKI